MLDLCADQIVLPHTPPTPSPPTPRAAPGSEKNVCDKKGGELKNEVKMGCARKNEVIK